MKLYRGFANGRDWQVIIERPHTLDPHEILRNRRDLRDHSPTGFAWGYGGSGPAQLALSLLADALGDDERALALHQAFKWKYIGRIPQGSDWAMSEEIVRILADVVEAEEHRNYSRLGRPEDRQDMKSNPPRDSQAWRDSIPFPSEDPEQGRP